MSVAPIRTITLGIAEPHPLNGPIIERAKKILEQARRHYEEAGYVVQTVRLATRPIFDDLSDWSSEAILAYSKELQRILEDEGLEFCSLGTVQVARPEFPLERLESVADMLIATSALSMTVQLALPIYGLRVEAAEPTARIIQRLSQETAEGFGNFRFAMLAYVAAGCPFFPTAYHSGPASLSIGLQGASIVADALRGYVAESTQIVDLGQVTRRVRNAIVAQATPIVRHAQVIAQTYHLDFGGIDLSPAPLGEDSIVKALEQCGYGLFGSAGTVGLVEAVTAALKSSGLPTCGYCGLMLPVLEDAELGRRWAKGHLSAHQLLLYSSVCGTGLDTIPLPGDSTVKEIAQLLLDVATLAQRLQKPLSARLFPVPGRQAGEHTAFTSQYLTNTMINF